MKLLTYFFKIEMIKATLKGVKSISSLPKKGGNVPANRLDSPPFEGLSEA